MALPEGITEHIGGYPVHPVASMFPMIEDSELRELADDISENGQNEPIVLVPYYDDFTAVLASHGLSFTDDEWCQVCGQYPEVEAELEPDMVIIDGRNRMSACLLAGVEPRVTYDIPGNTSGKDSDSPDWEQYVTAWITSSNIHRRHLSKGQRAAIAAEMVEFFAADAKKRSEANLKQNNPAPESAKLHARSDQQAASMVDVSARTVADAKKVMDNDPEMFKQVKAGKLAPSAAAKKIRDAEKPAPTEAEVKSARETLIQKEIEKLFRDHNTPEERTLLSHYFHLYEGNRK